MRVLLLLCLCVLIFGVFAKDHKNHHGSGKHGGKGKGHHAKKHHQEVDPVPVPVTDENNDGIPDNEADLISQITQIFSDSTTSLANANSPWLRQAHVKQHACMRATLAITNNDPDYQSGVFIGGTTYNAFVRWSNGAGPGFATGFTGPRNDASPDNRAIAIKILGVPGDKMLSEESDAETQDFLFTTSQAAFLVNAADALDFFKATAQGTLAQGAYLALHPTMAKLYAVETPAAGLIKDLSTGSFYSNVPNRFGNTYAKFMLDPCDGNPSKFTLPGATNYYHDRCAKDIASGDICYGLYVQLYEDDQSTPLEDGTAVWKTEWTMLGTLTFDSSLSWGSDGQEEFCENLSFNPWHTLPAHEPIGGIQRVRKSVYTTMGQLRAQFGGFAFAEPTSADYDNFDNL